MKNEQNTNQFRLVSVVPTVYQLSSLNTLMGESKPWGGGSYGAEIFFNNREEAIEWMKERNDHLRMTGALDEQRSALNAEDIGKYGIIAYDAAMAKLEEVEA